MSRLPLLTIENAPDAAKAGLQTAQINNGFLPNLVRLLANAPADASRGLVAGTIVTTGSCTGAPLLPGPGDYHAEFATLGSVGFRFTA